MRGGSTTPIAPERTYGEGVPTPGDYLRQLYFDTMVFEATSCVSWSTEYGADHVLLGTDYPYDMGETDPLAWSAERRA